MKYILNKDYLPHHTEFRESLVHIRDGDFEKELDAVVIYRWRSETVEVRFRVWRRSQIVYSGLSLDEAIEYYNKIEK